MGVNKGCLDKKEFLIKAGEFFETATKKNINVHLTMKRFIEHDDVEGNKEFDSTNHPHYDISKRANDLKEYKDISKENYPILFRISYGSGAKKYKCSTKVPASDMDSFWQEYSAVLRKNMSGLIKKKKKKSEKKTKGKVSKKK